MNKSYLIVPVILLAVFGFIYRGALKDMDTKAAQQQAALDERKAADAKHKDEVEAKATAEAQKKQAEREAADLAKEQKKEADYNAVMKQLRDETADFVARTEKLSKEAADLENQISAARNDKERLARESLDLAKQVELEKISRRNAELEIQRMVDMLAKKLNESSIAAMPPPPLAIPTK